MRSDARHQLRAILLRQEGRAAEHFHPAIQRNGRRTGARVMRLNQIFRSKGSGHLQRENMV
jgi:hypothetical protein